MLREASVLKTYTGSFHCGVVRFEADIDLADASYRCTPAITSYL